MTLARDKLDPQCFKGLSRSDSIIYETALDGKYPLDGAIRRILEERAEAGRKLSGDGDRPGKAPGSVQDR